MSKLPLDHIAYRVRDRDAARELIEILGYTKQTEFLLRLKDGSQAFSYALTKPGEVDVFISSGVPNSLIGRWVKKHGERGGVHHLAYATDDVAGEMARWAEEGVEFQTEKPLVCSCDNPITQVFTKESPATGVVYELIHRNGHPGFCEENVKRLMDGSASE